MLNVVFNNNKKCKVRCKINSFITKCVLAPKIVPLGSGFRGASPPGPPDAAELASLARRSTLT